MELKYCVKCDLNKPIEKFSKSSKKDGLSSICKECHKTYRKEYYKKNREKELKQVKKYQKENFQDTISGRRKKSGRNYKSTCKLEKCNSISYLSKRDLEEGNKRYCSKECSYKGLRVSPYECHLSNIKSRANKINKKFNIDSKYLKNLYKQQKGKCAITNVFIKVNHEKDKTILYETASLDRIDSSKGYIKGNVQWVMLGINYMKLNFTDNELHKTLEMIVSNYTGTTS